MLTRPAIEQSKDAPSIKLAQNTPFQAALANAWKNSDPRKALKAEAAKYVKSKNYVRSAEDLPVSHQLMTLSASLDALEAKKTISRADLSKAADEAFGNSPGTPGNRKMLADSAVALKDSLIAIKFLPGEHHKPLESLTNKLRDIDLVSRLNEEGALPATGADLRRFRKRSVMLPNEADLKSAMNYEEKIKDAEKKRGEEEVRRQKVAENKFALYNNLKKAVKELTTLDEDNFNTTPQFDKPGYRSAEDLSPVNVYSQILRQQQQFAQLSVVASRLAVGKSAGDKTRASRTGAAGAAAGSEAGQAWTEVTAAGAAGSIAGKSPLSAEAFEPFLIGGTGDFKIPNLSEISFRLKAGANEKLTGETRELLNERNLAITERSLDSIVNVLRTEITDLSKELDGLFGRPEKHSFKRMGNAMIVTKTAVPTAWSMTAVAMEPVIITLFFPDLRVPLTHGSVAPAGVADLLVVKQQLVRYTGTDVAHIENILKGEKKEKEHTRRRETEELIFRESEITTSEERSLESTSRFELSRETSETIREESSLKAGLSITGKYGPVVEFSANAEGSLSRSKEAATRTASRFSQDVTERSASKVTQRLLERSSLRVTNEVIEKNLHSIDNTGGTGHISGVYQWVEKIYQAQMYNYGLRTIYDFMVPEPGAFLIEAMQSAHASSLVIEKPVKFTLRPQQITESNYHYWIQTYGATGVNPPPEMYITKSQNFKAGGGDSKTHYNHSGQIDIDEGYKAVQGVVGVALGTWDVSNFAVDVVLSNRAQRMSAGQWIWSTGLGNVTGSVAFGVQTFQVSYIAGIIEVKCQRNDRAMMLWRHDTHSKLTAAYHARLAEYEEKLSRLQIQAGVAIEGQNPALNLGLMKDELKKNCVTIMTEQHFDMFNAISNGLNGLPQINLYENRAEGPYVRFFEQAFEWEHMTWVTYPYFWGRKNKWTERIAYEDNDPMFNDFLKSGYCRVNVPVREGFEGAIDHFMTFGEIWDGGPLPPISSPLYLPIADEIAERMDRPGGETPQGEPWLVRVPTSLVHLRPDDRLPEWEKNDEGEWVEVNNSQ